MTTLAEITELARLNFERAQTNLDADEAAAPTPAARRAVRDHRDKALAAYMDLLTVTLDGFEGDWEALAGRAKGAAQAVEDATERAAARADRVRLIADVTSSLADIAKALRG